MVYSARRSRLESNWFTLSVTSRLESNWLTLKSFSCATQFCCFHYSDLAVLIPHTPDTNVVSAGREWPINGFSLQIRSDLPNSSEWNRVLEYVSRTALIKKELDLFL
jgi:hypothetical protein